MKAPRAELLHVLMLPDFERAARIGEFWGYPQRRALADDRNVLWALAPTATK